MSQARYNGKNPPSRTYMFTVFINDETEDWLPEEREEIRYLIMQAETCPKSGRTHWQGYVEFNKPVRLAAAKQLLGTQSAHLEKRRGTQKEAIKYCRKKETRYSKEGIFYSFGDPAKEGRPKLEKKPSGYSEVFSQEMTVDQSM